MTLTREIRRLHGAARVRTQQRDAGCVHGVRCKHSDGEIPHHGVDVELGGTLEGGRLGRVVGDYHLGQRRLAGDKLKV